MILTGREPQIWEKHEHDMQDLAILELKGGDSMEVEEALRL